MSTRYTPAGLLLTALAGAALAQAPGIQAEESLPAGGRGANQRQLTRVEFPGGYCDLYLLAQEAVQTDLNLSADQVARVRELVADLIEKKRTLRFEAHVEQLRKHQQIALDLLRREQVNRLKQVSLQCGATASFWNPQVRNDLQVSDEQYQKIQSVPYAQGLGDEKAEELARIRKDFLDYPKRAAAEWQQREWKRIAVLTPVQRAQWKEMLGKPFQGTFPSAVVIPAAAR